LNGAFGRTRFVYLRRDDPGRCHRGVLGFLGLDLPAGRTIQPRHERQADELSDQWIERYGRDLRVRSGFSPIARGTPPRTR
jgi:LPS sulfotransferase NodH